MLFATYQPYNPDKDRRSPFYQTFEDYLGWYPVWCFKADTLANFLFGSWSSAPTCPERLIFFESDDYIEYDVVKYNQLLCSETLTKDSLAECFENPGKFKEVIVNDIPNDGIEMDIEEMMFEFDCEDGIGEVNMHLAQRVYELFYNNAIEAGAYIDRALDAIFKKSAMEIFLGKMAYGLATSEYCSAFDFVPMILSPELTLAANLWDSATLLRNKIFEEDGLGTEDDYRTMKNRFFACCAQSHSAFISQIQLKRNDLCPCGSGKKLKHCCMSFEKYSSVVHESLAQ